MRILHIDDYFLPSLGYEAELARAQHAAGHDVSFAASNRVPGEKAGVSRPASHDEFPARVMLLRPLAIGNRFILLPGIVGVLLRVRPEAVHCHSIFDLTAVAAAVFKPLLGYRLVYCCHTSSLNTDARSTWWRRMAYRTFRGVFGWIIKAAADEVVAVNENSKAMLVDEFALEPDRIGTLRIGVSDALFKIDEATRLRDRARLGLGEEDVILLHTGTLAPRKRLHDLVEAVARVPSPRDRIRVMIVGGGDPAHIAATRELARIHGLAEQTLITDRFVSKAELLRYYAAADVGVWPGDYSIATLEAMASGLPVIVRSDDPCTGANDPYTEFLTSNDNGFRFTQGDTRSLADSISDLARGRQRRLDMGRASRELAMAEFNWSSIAEKSLALYRRQPSEETAELDR